MIISNFLLAHPHGIININKNYVVMNIYVPKIEKLINVKFLSCFIFFFLFKGLILANDVRGSKAPNESCIFFYQVFGLKHVSNVVVIF